MRWPHKADDLDWRKKHKGKFLERAFSLTTYFDAYKDMWLDTYAELQRWRDAGLPTPSAPPEAPASPFDRLRGLLRKGD